MPKPEDSGTGTRKRLELTFSMYLLDPNKPGQPPDYSNPVSHTWNDLQPPAVLAIQQIVADAAADLNNKLIAFGRSAIEGGHK